MRVEVLDILAQHDLEVAWSGDQEVVEAFPAQGADEAFRDSVHPRCLHRGADDGIPAPAKTASNAAVNLLSRSRIGFRYTKAVTPS